MSSTCESETFSKLLNDIEYCIFLRDGNVDFELLEKLINCTSHSRKDLIGEIGNVLQCLPTGDYHGIFNGPFARCLHGFNQENIQDYGFYLKEKIQNELLSESKESQCLRQLLILLLGISCLQLVIQQNWTGPPLKDNEASYLLISINDEEQLGVLRNQSFEFLRKDGEDAYVLFEFPVFLLIARIILVDCGYLLTETKTQVLWQLRCIHIHQQLLKDLSSSLKTEAFSAMERCDLDEKKFPWEIMCRVCLEQGYHFLQYYEHSKAKQQFQKAQEYAGLELELGGALGKRTKFQQFDYPQLTAKATLKDHKDNMSDEINKKEFLPKDVMLDDDTLLNKPKFTHAEETVQEKLSPLHLATVLAACFYRQKSQASHELLEEELLANVALLLSQPQVWTVQTVALLLRSKLEKKSSRRKERSMMQVQQLVDQYRESNAKLSLRLKLFYSILFPARWQLERELAGLFRELFITKSALEIYERLHLWDDVISCYLSLGRYEKAEEVVRKQLSVKETPKLWCLLGDVTKDEEYYHKAWQLSKSRSARAQRSLGYLYLRDKKYPESVPCFQKSLEINSLQENVWFSLGCAAMLTEKLDVAAKAFHWCVSMNPDNSEAWNNLSSVYIKANQKNRAFKTLQEALKANYENWQMWENFLLVSTDVGGFEEVISATHRLMDMKEKYFDVEVLGILVHSVVSGKEDRKGLPASRLKPAVKKLMGRVTSQITSSSDVWKLYSDLYKDGESGDEKEKFLQFLMKAHRAKIQSSDWEKSKETVDAVIQLTLELSQAHHEASLSPDESSTRAIQLLSSSKLNLRGLITKLKNNCTNPVTGELDYSLSESLVKIENELEKTLSRIDVLKSTR